MQFLDKGIKVEEAQIKDTRGLFLIPQMYSKPTDMHQYLHPLSCHTLHVTNNLPTAVISWIQRNCSDNVDNDRIFTSTMIQYKAHLLKPGHSEKLVDKQFINYALKVNRKKLLEKKTREKSYGIVKYQMVTDFEPTFPDIRKAFRKF